jgi:hypothetical protein
VKDCVFSPLFAIAFMSATYSHTGLQLFFGLLFATSKNWKGIGRPVDFEPQFSSGICVRNLAEVRARQTGNLSLGTGVHRLGGRRQKLPGVT